MTDIRSSLRSRLHAAIVGCGWEADGPIESAIILELPREFAHGDLASPVAFVLAKALKKNPREVATALAEKLGADALIDRVEVAGGGYLNFFLGDAIWRQLLASVESAGTKFGAGAALAGQKFHVEFVSANPTGPLVVANARAASFGDSLCRCLEAVGAAVRREYYVNDAGQQVRNLALSVEARWREAMGQKVEIPKDGYHGEYVKDLAKLAREKLKDGFLDKPEQDRITELKAFTLTGMMESQRKDLLGMRVNMANFQYESALHAAGKVDAAFKGLESKGVVFEKEGAKWFKATDFGEEKDRVLMKSDGQPTYTLPDVAYHQHKFSQGFDRVVTIVGADHQTEMATLRNLLKALGEPVDKFEVIIYQFVTLKRGAEVVKMSKRSGDVVMLDELIEEVGPDAARFFFLMRAPSSHMDFDMELAKSTTMDNPVYYLQYAHARLCSLIDRAREEGIGTPSAAAADPAKLAEPETRMVLRKLARFPLIVEKAALGRAPHLLTHELLELAQAVHQFYTHNRVVGAETNELAVSRLALVAAARQVIANGLDLLGVSAPERMKSNKSDEEV